MQRIGKMISSGVLVALFACSGGSSDPAASLGSSPPAASTSTSSSTPVTTPLDGKWVSVVDARALERRGFSTKQIHLLQKHDEWSSRQVNEISINGDAWILSQGLDGVAPSPTNDFGKISVTGAKVRLDDGTCFLVLRYRLDGDALQMNLVRSTCDNDPTDVVPDYFYAAVFGQPFQRRG